MQGRTPDSYRGRITKLRWLIDSLDLLQYKVGAACNIDPNTISLYARGLRPVAAHHLDALCTYFGLSPSDIIGYVDDDPTHPANRARIEPATHNPRARAAAQ
jgi:DNA-binding Xre family transcriptional regulator